LVDRAGRCEGHLRESAPGFEGHHNQRRLLTIAEEQGVVISQHLPPARQGRRQQTLLVQSSGAPLRSRATMDLAGVSVLSTAGEEEIVAVYGETAAA